MTLNPFKSLPNPREVWAWGMYDLANQSFQLLINTLLFAIYVAKVIAPNPDAGKTAWGLMAAVAIGVVASPPRLLLPGVCGMACWITNSVRVA